MAKKSHPLGRKPVKREQVIDHLRRLIVSGKFQPGARLPTYEELCRRLHAESPTIRAAIAILIEEGFIETRPRHGSFVAANPPHLHQIGLVFYNDPKSPPDHRFTWSRYFQALTQVAAEFECTSGRRVLQFYGINWHTDAPDRARLIEHLQTQRLAGVVFANIPLYMDDSPILRLPGIPRIAFEADSLNPSVRAVNFDDGQWLDKALDWLVSQGRRRVAIIRNMVDGTLFECREHRRFCEALDRHGMATKPRWLQVATINQPLAARQAAELLMADRERPDALLVTDDNYVEPALEGLLAAGVRVPDDVAVVGHANWPLPPARVLPIRLLGYDQRAMLRVAVEAIDRWRAGDPPHETIIIPALWEEEVAPATLPPRQQDERNHEMNHDRNIPTTLRYDCLDVSNQAERNNSMKTKQRVRSGKQAIALGLATLALVSGAEGATRTWNGAGGDDYWSNTNNWAEKAAPTSADAPLFTNLDSPGVSVSDGGDWAVNGLQIKNPDSGTVGNISHTLDLGRRTK